jgi:quercetin dioxygenase-like cupin family protein
MVGYQQGAVVSKEIIKSDSATITLFAFDKGQSLSEHTAPFEVMVNVIDGTAEITVSGHSCIVNRGQMIIIPCDCPHSLKAKEPFKMLLIMARSRAGK